MYAHATKLSFCVLVLENLACLECSVFIYMDLLGCLVTYQLIVTTIPGDIQLQTFATLQGCNHA